MPSTHCDRLERPFPRKVLTHIQTSTGNKREKKKGAHVKAREKEREGAQKLREGELKKSGPRGETERRTDYWSPADE